MLLATNFVFNLFCGIVSCNPKLPYPSDPNNTFSESLGRSKLFENEGKFEKYPIVKTNSGSVQGFIMKTISKRSIYAFQGIPYGENTGGENRFQPPVPKAKWEGVRKAMSEGSICLQNYHGRIPILQGREDCLFLSIYTIPESINSTNKLPVIFWLHGGGFNFGAGSDYGPAFMLENDVILVTINYRLGIFGFLSTGDDIVPGNNGLKDQALALKWIYENIEQFGGDKSRITLMGQSAGASSVHFHMLSSYYNSNKNNERYFSRAISQSGSTFSYWSLRNPEKLRYLNRKLAKQAGCPYPNGRNSLKFLKCLKNIDPYVLNSVQYQLFPIRFVPIILFGPVIEKPIRNSNISSQSTDLGRPFLTRHPDELYAEEAVAKIPWMVTRNSGEAYLFSFITTGYGILSRLAVNYLWRNFPSDFLDYRGATSSEDKITEKIENYYFGGKDVSEVEVTALDYMFTARAHTTAIHKSIQSHSKLAPTYAMLISGPINYELTLSYLIGAHKQPRGVIHADEVFLMFNGSDVARGVKTTEPEFKLSRLLTELVFNFVNNGTTSYSEEFRSTEMNDHWDAVEDPCKVRYLNVTLNDGNKMVELPRESLEEFDFWLTLGLNDLKKSPNVSLPTCSS